MFPANVDMPRNTGFRFAHALFGLLQYFDRFQLLQFVAAISAATFVIQSVNLYIFEPCNRLNVGVHIWLFPTVLLVVKNYSEYFIC